MSLDFINKIVSGPVIWRSEPLTGGLNNRYQAQYIGDNEASELFNVDLDDVTRPKARDGYLVLGGTTAIMQASINSGLLAKRIAGVAYLHTTYNTKKLFIAIDDGSSGRCYWRTDVTATGYWTEALVTTTVSFAVNTSDAPVFQINDGLMIIPEVATNVHTMDNDGALYDGGNTNTSPPRGAVDGCAFLNRAWLLKQGTTANPPELHYSKLLPSPADPSTQFNRDGVSVSPTLAGRLQLAADRGGQAVAVKPWNEVSLIVFFNSCIEEILVFNANPQGGSIRRVIEETIGCASRDSVVSVGQEMFFADQFGQIRSLQLTVSNAQAGVVALPLSERIASELPGKLNQQYRNKIRSIKFKDRMFVAYPRLGSTEANAVAVYHLGRKIWESIWILKHPVGRWFVSDIRGSGDELWFSDGSTTTGQDTGITCKLYRFFPATYSDDGYAIKYMETTKAFDFGVPEADKIWDGYEADARGSDGVTMETGIRFDEDSGYTDLEGAVVISAVGSSFPILESDFPLTPADFPLVAGVTTLARKRQNIYGVLASETDADPIEARSRIAQLQITCNVLGKQFQRSGYRLWARVQRNEGIDWATETT